MALPIPQPVKPFVTALRRRETYLGYAREAMSFAKCVARYPLGFGDGGLRSGRPSGEADRDTPVLLVHGFGHNRSGWFVVDEHLRHAGLTSVHRWNYDPFRHDVPELAEMLGERVERLCAATGFDRVHVVGHSLGGILLRWYIQELGGDARVITAITVASPHQGTRLASFVPSFGSLTAQQLAPGSWLMRRLERAAAPSAVRWVAFYSNLDFFVQPATSAMITTPALRATNVLVKDAGHLSILLSSRVADGVVDAIQHSPVADAVAS
ncbi:MAG: alpha/beta fold hydrolase [Actinobacteria bacterium]|nr:alpha/beta fold hydrolase [Actinomycetota bacterium]